MNDLHEGAQAFVTREKNSALLVDFIGELAKWEMLALPADVGTCDTSFHSCRVPCNTPNVADLQPVSLDAKVFAILVNLFRTK